MRSTFLTQIVLALFVTAQARVTRIPIQEHLASASIEHDVYHAWLSEDEQEPLKDDPARTPISDMFFASGLNIRVGSPPQVMRVLLDINMDTFFMQSASCNSTICNADHIGFNSSLSSTYAPTPLEQTIYYANVLFEGNLATDVLNVGGCDILSQGFLDATDAWPAAYVHLYYGYDGALGLAPGWANRRPHVPTLWENLVNEELLEKNIFSITLPSGERTMLGPPRENGELVLGGLPQGFREDESISLPLKFSTSVLRPWMTSLQSLTYGNNTLTFSNTTSSAYFTTVYPWISLPVHFARSILATIGYWEEMYPFIKFPCWLRGGLPDLIFGIGGHNVSLDPYQYSFVVRRSTDDPWLCAIALDRSDNHTVALGWSFMENFHVVFDTDAAVILLSPHGTRTG